MADTFAVQRADFFARGFDYLNDGGAGLARTKSLYNSAYRELCAEDNWPFLSATAVGAAPLLILDLRVVRSVRDTAQPFSPKLWQRPVEDIEEDYGLLTTTGTPLWYYVENGSVTTYPYSTNSLSVRYYKIPAELANDTDEPLVPNEYRRYIVDGMVRLAAMEDNPELAANAEAERQRGISLMRRALINPGGAPEFMRHTGYSLDE